MSIEDSNPRYKALERSVTIIGRAVRRAAFAAALFELWRHGAWPSAVIIGGGYLLIGLSLGVGLGFFALGVRAAAKT